MHTAIETCRSRSCQGQITCWTKEHAMLSGSARTGGNALTIESNVEEPSATCAPREAKKHCECMTDGRLIDTGLVQLKSHLHMVIEP